MSIASIPSQKNELTMIHDVSPMGPGSKWTLALQVGDTAQIMAPLGIFTLKPNPGKRKVLVATGSGVAPFCSMVADYYSSGGKDEIILYWGLRHEEDIYWKEQFEQLSRSYPQFQFAITLSQPKDDWKGMRGRVTEHVVQEEKNILESDFYLCGSHAMVEDIKTQLATVQVPKEHITTELYF
jgi:NAD(P)H-flavin reductase